MTEPFEAGAVQLRLRLVPERVPVRLVGAAGTAAGVTAEEAAELAEVPAEFVAETLKTYDVPLVRPVTVAEVPVPVVAKLVQVLPESLE